MDSVKYEIFEHLCAMIGTTPLSKITFEYRGQKRSLYVKHEHYNYTGSVKDRMALFILYNAYKSGQLRPGDIIAEATSGNTGIALASIGKVLGHDVHIFMPDWLSQERINLIRSFGANITLVSKAQGGFMGAIEKVQAFAHSHNKRVFLPSQFSNIHNCEAHFRTTGPEIVAQLNQFGKTIDAFVAGVGTGGTVMGVGAYLRQCNPHVKVYPLEPANSPTLSTGYKIGKHRIEGISDEFIPDLVCLKTLDDILSVADGDAIMMARKLACSLGLGVGISSGANFLGAIKAQELLHPDSVVVTMFPDDNKKYLSTDLMVEQVAGEDDLTPHIHHLQIERVVNLRNLDIQEKIYKICRDPNTHQARDLKKQPDLID